MRASVNMVGPNPRRAYKSLDLTVFVLNTWLACPGFLVFLVVLHHILILLSMLVMFIVMLTMLTIMLSLPVTLLIMPTNKLLIMPS